MTKRAKFIIELDLETLDEMTGIFERLDIEFDAVENMVCFPQDEIRQNILTGTDMDQVIANANIHLDERRQSQKLREEFRQMSPETRWDLMVLLAPSTARYGGKVLSEIDTQAWENFQRQHPEAVRLA